SYHCYADDTQLYLSFPPDDTTVSARIPDCLSVPNPRLITLYLTQYTTQLLVQTLVISRLGYCNALLTGLPAFLVKPLQMVQNAAVCLVFNQPKRAHVTPLLIELHWLPVAARIKFKSLM